MSDRRFVQPPRRRPEDLIPPTAKRHRLEPKPTPESEASRIEIALRFRSIMLSHQLGLEIQAACGLCPPDRAQREGLKTHRSIAADRNGKRVDRTLPAEALAALKGAFEDLLARRACSHCEARFECRGRHIQ